MTKVYDPEAKVYDECSLEHCGVLSGSAGIFDERIVEDAEDRDSGEDVTWEKLPYEQIWFIRQLGVAVGRFRRLRHQVVVIQQEPLLRQIQSHWEHRVFMVQAHESRFVEEMREATKEWLSDPFGSVEAEAARKEYFEKHPAVKKLVHDIAQVLSKPPFPEDCLNEPLFPALLFPNGRKE